MLTIICGEDTSSSRNALRTTIQNYTEKNYEVREIDIEEIEQIDLQSAVINLFGQEPIYVVENLSKKYKGRKKTALKEKVQQIARDKNLTFIDWEEGKGAYELSALNKIATTFDEYKPSESVFNLLENIVPNNLKRFLNILHEVEKTSDVGFIYAMICKHSRSMLVSTIDPSQVVGAPWQKRKTISQARNWNQKNLSNFHYGLAKIDEAMKTSTNTFDLTESIELLAYHYLR